MARRHSTSKSQKNTAEAAGLGTTEGAATSEAAENTADAHNITPEANLPETASPFFAGRAIAVYALALVLLALLESDRLQAFLEQSRLPGALQAATVVDKAARLSGAALVSSAEGRLASQLTVQTVVGAIAVSSSVDSPNENAPKTVAVLAATSSAAPRRAFMPPLPELEKPTVSIPEKAVSATLRQSDMPTLLIVGDSLIMEGLGPALHRTLRKRTDINVMREGRYSTGLTRTDTFNWPDRMRELVALHNPDIILVCLGANDSQDILLDGKRHIAGTPSWKILYSQRADRFLAEATAKGAMVIWLGLPIMGKPPYEARIRLLSDLQEASCTAEPLCRFQNGMAPLADAHGNYLAFVLDSKGQHVRLRYKDMVHVTESGGQRLVDNAMPLINTLVDKVKAGITVPVPPTVLSSPVPVPPVAPPAVVAPAVPDLSQKKDVYDVLLKE